MHVKSPETRGQVWLCRRGSRTPPPLGWAARWESPCYRPREKGVKPGLVVGELGDDGTREPLSPLRRESSLREGVSRHLAAPARAPPRRICSCSSATWGGLVSLSSPALTVLPWQGGPRPGGPGTSVWVGTGSRNASWWDVRRGRRGKKRAVLGFGAGQTPGGRRRGASPVSAREEGWPLGHGPPARRGAELRGPAGTRGVNWVPPHWLLPCCHLLWPVFRPL